jgi:gas vesicle protein
MDTLKKAKIFITSFAIGGLVGGLTGLLWAPKSGAETRGMIHDKSGSCDKMVETLRTPASKLNRRLEHQSRQKTKPIG